MIGCGGKMKISSLLMLVLLLSSCGQIQRVLDGTEKLPSQIDDTNTEIKKTNRVLKSTDATIHKQTLSEALKVLKDDNNRANLVPVPFDMLAAAKTFAETVYEDELVLFMKSEILKIKKQQSADVFPAVDEEKFQHGRIADYYMIMLIAGFLPPETVEEMVTKESDQGAYQDIMLNVLKLRYDFNNNMMLILSMLGLDPSARDAAGQYAVLDKATQLDTLGKISKAIEYNEKIEYICNLEFVEHIGLEIEGFPNDKIDPRTAKANWQLILDRAQSDYKATSLSKDSATNDKYTTQYNALIDGLKARIAGTYTP